MRQTPEFNECGWNVKLSEMKDLKKDKQQVVRVKVCEERREKPYSLSLFLSLLHKYTHTRMYACMYA